jgi:Tol biopolymer transport system component
MRTRLVIAAMLSILALAAPASTAAGPGSTELISVDATYPSFETVVTPDGRYVLFNSGDIVPPPGHMEAFVYDRQTGITEQVSVDPAGQLEDFNVGHDISDDGRYVVMVSDPNFYEFGDSEQIFVRDRQTGTTTRVTVDVNGDPSVGHHELPAMSGDGRYVTYFSNASFLVPGDFNGQADVFVYDVQAGQTSRVSVDAGGGDANNFSGGADISADGRYVAFGSNATDLLPGGNAGGGIFVRDLQAGVTELAVTEGYGPALSRDGRYIAYLSLGSGGLGTNVHIFDRQARTTELVSVDRSGRRSSGHASQPTISDDGRFVSFTSQAAGLVGGDGNQADDVFLRDRQTGWTSRISVDGSGGEGPSVSFGGSLSADGRLAGFGSWSPLSPLDTNAIPDAYLRDQDDGDGVDWAVDNCPVVANAGQADLDGDGAGNVCDDGDHDGCTDAGEQSADPATGGGRSATDIWDYYDVPTVDWTVKEKMGRDYVVSVSDVSQLIVRFGSSGDPLLDPLSDVPYVVVFPGEPIPLDLLYHTAYDRTLTGPNMWNSGPPNGSITVQDIALMVAQFGHSCA